MHIQDAGRRAEIVAVAGRHFRLYGYDRTTVADVAKAVGFSSGYVYRFFASKQAIGEAVCDQCLAVIDADMRRIAMSDAPPDQKINDIFHSLAWHARELALQDCKLKDMVITAHDGRWETFEIHEARLSAVIARTVAEGRELGVFERVTPADDTCRAILWVLEPFRNPALWSERADTLKAQASDLAALVLRSLNNQK